MSSSEGLRVHHPRRLDTARHRRFPITTVERTLLDLAARASLSEVRRALAEADYRRRLDLAALEATLGRGRPGAARLRQAWTRHQPRLARTRSGLERRFLELCERARLPLPEVNARVGRMTVDAVWPDARLAAEVDGHGGHSTPAQIERDRRRELHLRRAGFTVVRYTAGQLSEQPDLVAADLRAQLSPLARSA